MPANHSSPRIADTEVQNFTGSLPDELMPKLSNHCLLWVEEHLDCHAHYASDNVSELICDPKDGEDSAESARAHAIFLLVVVF